MSTLEQRARVFRQHLIHFTDADGLVAGEVNARGPRRFIDDDFRGFETWDLFKEHYADFLSYEDSIMTTGRFVHAEVLRHLADDSDTDLGLAERSGRARRGFWRSGRPSRSGMAKE